MYVLLYKSYTDKRVYVFREKAHQTRFREASVPFSKCVGSFRVPWGGLNKFPVEGTSSGSQPTMLDEFEAEIR